MAEPKLIELKKQYEKFRSKYNLPSFQELNYDFDIEKLQEKETDLLLREIRRCIIDKNLSYSRFIEMLLNPSNAPMFFLALIKNLSSEENKLMNELYSELGKVELNSIFLENNYDEKKEAEFIKDFYKKWQGIKEKFERIMVSLEKSLEKKAERKDKGYLG